MTAPGSLTVEQLLASLRRRKAALPSEIGSFIVFEACEATLSGKPAVITAAAVVIDSQGGVRLLADAPPTDEQTCARSLHALLTSILLSARPGPTPTLMRLVERGPTTGAWTREALRDDLEASLVPLNRLACRRVLARLLREAAADRMRGDPTQATSPTFSELDAELGDLLSELPSVDGQTARGDEPTVREEIVQVDAHDTVEEVDIFQDAPTSRLDVGPAHSLGDAHLPESNEPASAGVGKRPAREQLPRSIRELSEAPRPKPRRGLWLGVAFVALAVLLVALVGLLRPDVLARLRGEPVAPPAVEPREAPRPVRSGSLVLHIEPPRSQVFMAVGRAPVEVRGVPVGRAQEFVAMAEGQSPTRALIEADDPWEQTPQGPFYELAMQTGRLREGQPVRLGDSLLPQSPRTPRRRDGRVRIVTTPRGAQVYRVVGFAPETRIEGLAVDATHRLVVWRDGYAPQQLTVSPADWPAAPAPAALERRVTLERDERPPRRNK